MITTEMFFDIIGIMALVMLGLSFISIFIWLWILMFDYYKTEIKGK